MPVPDMNGTPPWADFNDLKNKLNELVGKYNNLLVNLDSLNVVSLTADHIDAGTIDANLVTIRSDLTAGAYVQINGNGMTINDGSVDTFRADITGKVTMTGALIQSTTGYPRIVMDPDGELFGAYYNANESIGIEANYTGAPSLNFTHSGDIVGRIDMIFGYPEFYGKGGLDLLTENGDINLKPGGTGSVWINGSDFSKLRNDSATLQAILNAKASSGVNTDASGAHNHGISPGTQLSVVGGGFVTWVGAGDHVHEQN